MHRKQITKTTSGRTSFSLFGRLALLACLFAAWSYSLTAAPRGRVVDEPGLADDAPANSAFDESSDAAARGPAQARGIPTRLSELFIAGGPLMWPIAACSVVVVAFAFERMVVLRRRRVIPKDFVKRFLDHLSNGQLDRTTALALCEQNGSPIAEVFAHGVRKWGKPSVEVEQAIIDGGERQIAQLRKHLRVMNTIATISPLLGLLGTVWGMILCFNQIAVTMHNATDKVERLAEGIGIALIATAGGLCVAIPALVLYMYLAGRVDSVVMEMDLLAQKLVNLISAEAFQANDLPRIAPRPKTLGTSALKNS
jgi:biopolymer transport protein ExbB